VQHNKKLTTTIVATGLGPAVTTVGLPVTIDVTLIAATTTEEIVTVTVIVTAMKPLGAVVWQCSVVATMVGVAIVLHHLRPAVEDVTQVSVFRR
jgi:hypothetical protein